VAELSQAASAAGVIIGVLVEVNIGHNRCGVAPFGPALALAQDVLASPGLRFRGLMGYDGHCTLKAAPEERQALSIQANRLLADTRKFLEESGLAVEIASGAGSFTYRYAAEVPGVSEVQAGTYLLMDSAFREHGITEFDCALTVLATVTSRPTYPGAEGLAIIDAGRKSISAAYGNPEVKDYASAKVTSLSDEHGRIRFEPGTEPPRIGDKLELSVRDANGTVNQFDRFYVVRNQKVEDVWKIPNLGCNI
jgi:D-serine deaminase-like pyridoxal phosphate-dependent protein